MDLPQELVDKIIDGIWIADDSPSHTTTKAASLISRSWVDRSQHHLFRDICFSAADDQFRRWCDAVAPGPDGVSRHVRSLTIRATGSDGWWINEDRLERALPYFDSLRNVQALRVLNWDIGSFSLDILARCFTPAAEGVRLLQWDLHHCMERQEWIRVIGLFPLVDQLSLHPNFFSSGLLPCLTPGPVQKRLVFSGNRAADCLAGCRDLRFQEIHAGCGPTTKLANLIAVLNNNADCLETLSIVGVNRVITASNANAFASSLGGCHALRELSIDWHPVDNAPELCLVDAIPRGRIQSLRIRPARVFWRYTWNGGFNDMTTLPWVKAPHEKLAQAILRLVERNPGRKVSVWYVIPRVPYTLSGPVKDSVIALWEAVEAQVSFGFQMIEDESQSFGEVPWFSLG